jgi:hypothetical protein
VVHMPQITRCVENILVLAIQVPAPGLVPQAHRAHTS